MEPQNVTTTSDARDSRVKKGRLEVIDEYRIGDKARKALYAIGSVLFVLSLIYVGVFAIRNWQALNGFSRLGAGPLISAAVLYGLAHISSSAAWILGLRRMGQNTSFWTGVRINLITQIGKYLPGNVVHYFARAGLASASGVRLSSSGIATLLEILATLLAAALVASAAMLFDQAPAKAIHETLAGNIAFPILLIITGFLFAGAFLHFAKAPVLALVVASACVIVSFTLIGLSFFAVVAAVSPSPLSTMGAIGIFAVAWTVGYIVPGAPAGLGVREAILIAWLGSIIGSGPAVACVVLHRILTACVDAIAALLGYGWLRLERIRQ